MRNAFSPSEISEAEKVMNKLRGMHIAQATFLAL